MDLKFEESPMAKANGYEWITEVCFTEEDAQLREAVVARLSEISGQYNRRAFDEQGILRLFGFYQEKEIIDFAAGGLLEETKFSTQPLYQDVETNGLV